MPELRIAPVRATVFGLADAAVASSLAVGTALRGARVFHPRGVAHDVVLRVQPVPGETFGAPLLDTAGEHRRTAAPRRCAGDHSVR